jgi:hypothetical protein
MKPRLVSAQLTVEDFTIWLSLAARFRHLRYPFMQENLIPADRRDADLMLQQQSERFIYVLEELVTLGPTANVRQVHIHPLQPNPMCAKRDFIGIEWP